MMVQIAEFERELIRERVIAGMAEAKTRNVAIGRKHTLRPHQRAEAARMHLEEGKSIGAIAALFGCGRTVVHRAVQGAKQGLSLNNRAAPKGSGYRNPTLEAR
jgi:DNA invertase Pin-like site-specific DNA recombinase